MMKAVISAVCIFTAVSCDSYDDSEIWDALNELKEKVEALEAKVADNVSVIQSMVTLESIKAFEFDAEAGKVTLTLLDGKTVVIDLKVTGYPLITVVKEADGNYYWALCKDGSTELLMIGGAKVPVSVTPDLKISSEGEWMISADGGKTWVATGIFQKTSEEGGESAVFFTDVRIDGDMLVLTLADGTVVKVAVAGEAGFAVTPDSLWFSRTSMVRSAAVEMNNVKSYTITEKPEGWKASMDESYLSVTSPEDFNVSAVSGTVKILALFEGGAQPEIISVAVAYEPSISLSKNNDEIVVTMSEHTGDDFSGYLLYAWKESEFTTDAAVQWLNTEGYKDAPRSGSASYRISELADIDENEKYIVFAVPYLPSAQVAQGDMAYEASDLQTIVYGSKSMTWSLSDIRYDYAHLNAEFFDVNEYYGGFFEAGAWNAYGRDNVLESLSYDALLSCKTLSYDGPASAFPYGEEESDLMPATEYLVWMLPVLDKKKYSAEDFVTMPFTTPALAKDSSIPAPKAKVTDVTVSGFTAEVTPAAGAYKTYSAVFRSSLIPDNELELVTNIIRKNDYSKGNEINTVTTGSFDSKSDVCLLSVSVTEDGHYGKVLNKTVKIKELEYSKDLSVTVTDIAHGLGDVTLTLEFTGNPVSITYFAETFTYYTDDALQELLALGQFGNASKVAISKLEGGKLNISGLTVGSLYTFYAVVSDADAVSSYLYKYEFTPRVEVDYILDSSAGYEYGMPSLSGSWSGKNTYLMNVEKPSECVRYWLFKGDSEYFTGDPWTDSDKIITRQYSDVTVHEKSESALTYTHMHEASRIYMVWLDDKGGYHAIYEFDPEMPQ